MSTFDDAMAPRSWKAEQPDPAQVQEAWRALGAALERIELDERMTQLEQARGYRQD